MKPTTINPRAITPKTLAFEAGYRAAMKGLKRSECKNMNPVWQDVFEMGYDAYSKKMKETLK